MEIAALPTTSHALRLATLGTQRCVVITHQKGRNTKRKCDAQFRLRASEGYRKALRLMRLAENFACQ